MLLSEAQSLAKGGGGTMDQCPPVTPDSRPHFTSENFWWLFEPFHKIFTAQPELIQGSKISRNQWMGSGGPRRLWPSIVIIHQFMMLRQLRICCAAWGNRGNKSSQRGSDEASAVCCETLTKCSQWWTIWEMFGEFQVLSGSNTSQWPDWPRPYPVSAGGPESDINYQVRVKSFLSQLTPPCWAGLSRKVNWICVLS